MDSVQLEVMANIYLGPILFFPWASWSAGCSTEVQRSNCVNWCSVHRLQKQALNMLGCCNQGFNFSHMCHLRTLKNYVHFIQTDSPCISIKYCIIYSCLYFWHLWIAYLLLNLKCWGFFKPTFKRSRTYHHRIWKQVKDLVMFCFGFELSCHLCFGLSVVLPEFLEWLKSMQVSSCLLGKKKK